jgi:ferredoxin
LIILFLKLRIRGILYMAYVINSECISCGACEEECTVGAISEGDDIFVIDPELCIDCGACATVCPVEAPNPAE